MMKTRKVNRKMNLKKTLVKKTVNPMIPLKKRLKR